MTRLPSRPLLITTVITLLSGLVAAGAGLSWAGPPFKAPPAASVPAGSAPTTAPSPPYWRQLNARQREILQPLQAQWPTMDEGNREKWLNVAERYPKLSAAEQQRMQARMTQWAKLPPGERGEARLRFQQTRQLSPSDRQEKWAAYQALSVAEREDLIRQARRKAKPVFLADNMQGPRELQQALSSKRLSTAQGPYRKSNRVPSTAMVTAPLPTLVAPITVKAGPGATTNLLTEQTTPALRQPTGFNKVNTLPSFVDPATLLQPKGAQASGLAAQPEKLGNAGN